jgi:hypothetical protein
MVKKEDKLLSPAEVADIWNQRAWEMGYKTSYSRDSVTARRNKGKRSFEPDVTTGHMTLYKESRARAVQLYPKASQIRPGFVMRDGKPVPEERVDEQPV